MLNNSLPLNFQNKSSRIVHVLTLTFMLSGCAILPGQGPSSINVALHEESMDDIAADYTLVNMDANVVAKLGTQRVEPLSHTFRNTITGDSSITLGVGDKLWISIWESSTDGLFSTTEKKQTQIEITVDVNGKIYIPYVGHIQVAGKRIEEVRKKIQSGLSGKAVEPQVQVALSSNVSNNIAIVGDISKPGQYQVPIGGIRLVEALAQAGGSKQAAFDTEVTIVRGSTRSTARFDEILNYPDNNVWVLPKDTIQVMNKARTFTAFGAVTSNHHMPFKTETLSLAEALAQSGGLNDNLADAGGVFLFRFEPPEQLHKAQLKEPKKLYNGLAPTIYRLDFTQPQAFFLASSFMLRDKDMIYVADAPASDLRKFVSIFTLPILAASTAHHNFK